MTSSVLWKSSSPHYRFTRLTSIKTAALAQSTLFIELEAKRHRSARTLRVALRVPIDDPARINLLSKPWPFTQDDFVLHHVPATLLGDPISIPTDAVSLPIHRVQLDNLSRLAEAGASFGPGIHVLWLSYTSSASYENADAEMYEDGPPPRDPLLVIVRNPSEPGPAEPFVIADFAEGYKKHRAWLLLVPITAIADVVTFPIQLIGGMIIER